MANIVYDEDGSGKDEVVLTRWDMEDLEKGRFVEFDELVIRKQTQEEEDLENN